MVKGDPGTVHYVVPPGSMPGQQGPVVSWGQMWTLMANSKMSNEITYLVVKTPMENHMKIPRYHPIGKHINSGNALKGVGQLKLHPEAIRYWKEKGRM